LPSGTVAKEGYKLKRIIFLQDPNAIWLKGNLHSHTVNSDGKLTPEEMKEAYLHHGYDFLAVTDHEVYTDTRYLTDDKFTMVQGIEQYNNSAVGDKDIHVHYLWADTIEGIKDKDVLHIKERNAKYGMAYAYDMKQKGAFVQINHPHWSMINVTDIGTKTPYDAVEIMNYGTEWLENMGNGVVFWTEMLFRGDRVWGTGGDDNHNHAPIDSMYSDSFGGFTVVKARDRSPQAIMEALHTGSFYTSTGPEIYDFYIEDDMVHIKCSPCEKIYICCQWRPFQRIIGRHVTEFHTKLKGPEKFIRCECMDARGRNAWSNPIYLD
jgi:hypothetical protein